MYHAPGYTTIPSPGMICNNCTLFGNSGRHIYCGTERRSNGSTHQVRLMGMNGRLPLQQNFTMGPPQNNHKKIYGIKKIDKDYPYHSEIALPFGYDSDDSSMSSTTSSSARFSDKGNKRLSETPSPKNSTVLAENSLPRRRWGPRVLPSRTRTYYNHQFPPYRMPQPIAPDKFLAHPYMFNNKDPTRDYLKGTKWDALSNEIWDKFNEAYQTEDMFRKKITLWRFLYISIKSIFPEYGLYLVGSTLTGLGTESSDMDLCLYVRPLEGTESRAHALIHLSFLMDYIKTFSAIFSGVELIQAKVPILKFRDMHNGIEVDLNCNNVVGMRNTMLLNFYARMDWRVRPLVVGIKLWAQRHNINDAKSSTISSYSLVLMVIHYLQCGTSPAILPCLHAMCPERFGPDTKSRALLPTDRPPYFKSSNEQPLGELFLGFLDYYCHFEFQKFAVSVRTASKLPVEECRTVRTFKNDPHQWKLLCIEEPFDLTNTARSVYDPDAFQRVLEVFQKSHNKLASSMSYADIMEVTGPKR